MKHKDTAGVCDNCFKADFYLKKHRKNRIIFQIFMWGEAHDGLEERHGLEVIMAGKVIITCGNIAK